MGRTVEETPMAKDKTRTSATEIANGILRLIDTQQFQPGDRLREQDIADRFGVSRGPVREAFRILEARTAIRIEPMRGATIIRMSDEETVAAVEMSGVLFGLAARRATKHATDEERARFLEEARDLSQLAEGAVTPKEFYQATLRLGSHITRAARSAKLETQLADVRIGAPNIFGPLGFLSPEHRTQAASRWTALCDAINRNDASRAEQLAILVHEEACRNALSVGL